MNSNPGQKTLSATLSPPPLRGGDGSTSAARLALARVPEIIAFFWIVKVANTGMGEAASRRSATGTSP